MAVAFQSYATVLPVCQPDAVYIPPIWRNSASLTAAYRGGYCAAVRNAKTGRPIGLTKQEYAAWDDGYDTHYEED